MAGFTQALCARCWNDQEPERPAPRPCGDGLREVCCMCGYITISGIYTRVDPTTVPYPTRVQ